MCGGNSYGVACADGSSVLGALFVVADIRTGQQAATSAMICAVIGGVDHVRSFGVIGDDAADFGAGAEASNAADGSRRRGVDHARRFCDRPG